MQVMDYTKPIFVYYINTQALSRQRAEEETNRIINDHAEAGLQMWFVPCQIGDNRIECVYPGMPEKEFTGKMKDVLDNLLSMLDGISGSSEEVIEKLKINIRNIVLNELLVK